ncbi:unnamed protein product [Caenorhabditis angaria]|uniref:Uncharacterized protein n=1 Tax=Caenorhabditis angaria TaxID=860376 RepID=A0A9P1J3K3_9PELO|nr:unnamed protein product [Caenorhabditis angaria]
MTHNCPGHQHCPIQRAELYAQWYRFCSFFKVHMETHVDPYIVHLVRLARERGDYQMPCMIYFCFNLDVCEKSLFDQLLTKEELYYRLVAIDSSPKTDQQLEFMVADGRQLKQFLKLHGESLKEHRLKPVDEFGNVPPECFQYQNDTEPRKTCYNISIGTVIKECIIMPMFNEWKQNSQASESYEEAASTSAESDSSSTTIVAAQDKSQLEDFEFVFEEDLPENQGSSNGNVPMPNNNVPVFQQDVVENVEMRYVQMRTLADNQITPMPFFRNVTGYVDFQNFSNGNIPMPNDFQVGAPSNVQYAFNVTEAREDLTRSLGINIQEFAHNNFNAQFVMPNNSQQMGQPYENAQNVFGGNIPQQNVVPPVNVIPPAAQSATFETDWYKACSNVCTETTTFIDQVQSPLPSIRNINYSEAIGNKTKPSDLYILCKLNQLGININTIELFNVYATKRKAYEELAEKYRKEKKETEKLLAEYKLELQKRREADDVMPGLIKMTPNKGNNRKVQKKKK